MKRNLRSGLRIAGVVLMAGLASGCDEDCGGCGSATVVVETPCCENLYPYLLRVRVQDVYGFTLVGATVEVVVAAVPEQRLVATTGGGGEAVFAFEAPPDVVVIAYACAPGYACNAGEIITSPAYGEYRLSVTLGW